ncbi:hypothetical protein [Massilia sp. TN1-12]|uniref:hypothetical protein n=1 Tax=Massilia paldalensis TaxID=3377675 RepID=UPI00384E793C
MSRTPKKAPFDRVAGAHKPFTWIHQDVEKSPLIDFVDMTVDISTGLETCLGLVHASELEHLANDSCAEGEESPPTLGMIERHNLLRFAIATSKMLRLHSSEMVDWINEFKRVKRSGGNQS